MPGLRSLLAAAIGLLRPSPGRLVVILTALTATVGGAIGCGGERPGASPVESGRPTDVLLSTIDPRRAPALRRRPRRSPHAPGERSPTPLAPAAPVHATVGHFELPAADPHRAAAFYRQVFGWRIEPVPRDGPAYLKVRTAAPAGSRPRDHRGAIGGGIGEPAAIGSDRPLLVLHVWGAPLDACLERIVAAGGRVEQPPSPIGDAGWFARFRDPEGNLLGLWSDAVLASPPP